MIYWIARQDPKNPPSWEIINSETRKTIVYGLSESHAVEFANRRNKQQKKREK